MDFNQLIDAIPFVVLGIFTLSLVIGSEMVLTRFWRWLTVGNDSILQLRWCLTVSIVLGVIYVVARLL